MAQEAPATGLEVGTSATEARHCGPTVRHSAIIVISRVLVLLVVLRKSAQLLLVSQPLLITLLWNH